MQAINSKNMRKGKILPLLKKRARRIFIVPRRTFFLLSVLFLLIACSFGCAPSLQNNGNQSSSAGESNDLPDVTEDLIRERINDAFVRRVPEENAAAEPISWNFDEDEPKEITVVEKKIDGTRATIILDIKTTSSPRAREPRQLAGQIRTDWELKTGWALRRWEIVETENISMKYKVLPKPSAQNSNR